MYHCTGFKSELLQRQLCDFSRWLMLVRTQFGVHFDVTYFQILHSHFYVTFLSYMFWNPGRAWLSKTRCHRRNKNRVTWMPRWSNDFIKEKLQAWSSVQHKPVISECIRCFMFMVLRQAKERHNLQNQRQLLVQKYKNFSLHLGTRVEPFITNTADVTIQCISRTPYTL